MLSAQMLLLQFRIAILTFIQLNNNPNGPNISENTSPEHLSACTNHVQTKEQTCLCSLKLCVLMKLCWAAGGLVVRGLPMCPCDPKGVGLNTRPASSTTEVPLHMNLDVV